MITQHFFFLWLRSFLFTLAVEIPVYVVVSRGQVRPRKAALAGALCSCVTHPLLWFVWREFFTDYKTYVISGELLVGVVESLIFFAVARPVTLPRAISASFLANAASYGLGHLLHKLHWLL